MSIKIHGTSAKYSRYFIDGESEIIVLDTLQGDVPLYVSIFHSILKSCFPVG